MRKLHILTLLLFSAGKGSNHAGRLNQTALPQNAAMQCSDYATGRSKRRESIVARPGDVLRFPLRSGKMV
jgi:hypothetical protein